MTPEKHKAITENIARLERLRKSLIRQYEAMRDLKASDPRYMQKFRRFQKTAERIKNGGIQ
jgi:hypothetical protein